MVIRQAHTFILSFWAESSWIFAVSSVMRAWASVNWASTFFLRLSVSEKAVCISFSSAAKVSFSASRWALAFSRLCFDCQGGGMKR